jgi:uncharacterized protein (TIGR02145 family)
VVEDVWGLQSESEVGFRNDIVFDIDGNVYQTVQIGDQLWMKENLKVTKYKNGESLVDAFLSSSRAYNIYLHGEDEWGNYDETSIYSDPATNYEIYGYLYNKNAVDNNPCMEGWHVPGSSEWDALISYLGGNDVACGKLKEAGTEHWISPNTGATNESGFTGLPGGMINWSGSRKYDNMGHMAYFWSSSHRIYRMEYENDECVNFNRDNDNVSQASVRCIKD